MEKALVMHELDNTATAIDDLKRGWTVSILVGDKRMDVMLSDDVPFGHKFAIKPIARGDKVIKYGASIGLATADISTGRHVHSHNLEGARGRGDKK